MYRIRGKLVGVAPILFNRPTEAATKSLRTGARGGKFTEQQRIDEAMEKFYTNEHGIYWPGWNLKQTLLNGVLMGALKEGKRSAKPFIEATVFVEGDLLFGKMEPDYIHEAWGRRPPRTGPACLIKRPALALGWELPFTLLVVDERRNADLIRKGMEEGGLLVGMGSWRPEYGRFMVTEWEVIKDAEHRNGGEEGP